MINLELIRNAIRNPSVYGVAFALVGAIGIFGYSVYDGSNLIKQKQDGDDYISIQLSAFAPPSKDPIAQEVQKPKPKQHHRKKPKQIEAPPKPVPTDLQAQEKPSEEVKQEKIVQAQEKPKDAKEADVPTTIKSNPNAESDKNMQVLRFSEGDDNPLLRAIRAAIEKKSKMPDLARQRGYEDKVVIAFLLDTKGEISQIEIVRESQYQVLNKAALKALKRACKSFPKPEQPVHITIPINYTIENHA